LQHPPLDVDQSQNASGVMKSGSRDLTLLSSNQGRTTRHAGALAKAALERLGAWAAVEPKMAMAENVRLALNLVARGEAPLGIVYETDANIEPAVKVIGVFPDNTDDPIIYPVAATVNAKPGTIQYLAFLRSAAAKSIFQGYGFAVLAKPVL
jgi:molybdate transport system substrate-binding protein